MHSREINNSLKVATIYSILLPDFLLYLPVKILLITLKAVLILIAEVKKFILFADADGKSINIVSL